MSEPGSGPQALHGRPLGSSEATPVGEGLPAPEATPAAEPDWHGVSPRYLGVDLVGRGLPWLIAAAALGVAAWATGADPTTPGWLPVVLVAVAVAAFVVLVLVLAWTPARVRSIRYALRADDLVLRRGIMWRRVVAVPYGRMQLIDITRGPIARILGLAELRFVTAAAASGVVIPGLPQGEVEALRDRLVALAESRRAGL